jgi:hypothetical protein
MNRHARIMTSIMTTIISGQIHHQDDQPPPMNHGPKPGIRREVLRLRKDPRRKASRAADQKNASCRRIAASISAAISVA